jgi:DNA-binding response OmpR family regulator
LGLTTFMATLATEIGAGRRLLVVEDDEGLAALLERSFREEGFVASVAPTAEAALAKAGAEAQDCVVLDLMLPGMDGLAFCRRLRGSGNTVPILMLTVRGATEDKVRGLAAGADDYLGKPFSFDELLARVHSLIRRRTTYGSHILRHEGLELDVLARTARRDGTAIALSAKEAALLAYFMRNAGRTVSEEELLAEVWSVRGDPGTNVVHVYIHHLRRKIDRGSAKRLIHTVRGLGFLFGASQ